MILSRISAFFKQPFRRNSDTTPRLPVGAVIDGQYRVIGHLGQGGFGFTYLVKHVDGTKHALKECFPSEYCQRTDTGIGLRAADMADIFAQIQDGFREEARVLSELDHPNIVKAHRLIEADNTLYILMDKIAGETLGTQIDLQQNGLQRGVVRAQTRALLDALSYLHGKGYLHRDISPDNILIQPNGAPILIDFGSVVSVQAHKDGDPMLVVKTGYSPPEFYKESAEIGPNADLYQLAACMLHALAGEKPPHSVNRMHALVRKQSDPLDIRDPLPGMLDALEILPKNRLQSAADWQAALDSEPHDI